MRAILKHLKDRSASQTEAAISNLEAGVAAGEIKNAIYLDAKDTVNRAMGEAAEAFLATCPTRVHHMGEWWTAAYAANAFLSGAHYLPAATKRASKAAGLKEYHGFLVSLAPLAALLIAAKPLAVKRQTGPQAPKTPAQLEREAATMTCQCCQGRFLANTGVIAHHGYQRPGHGWQTASCMGARHLPFEAGRLRLYEMIVAMTEHLGRLKKSRTAIATGKAPIRREWMTRDADRKKVPHHFDFKASTFKGAAAQAALSKISFYGDFAALKKQELAMRDREIEALAGDIKRSTERHDGWVQTHTWNANSETWTLLRVRA